MTNLTESIILNEKIPMDLASALKRSTFTNAAGQFNDEEVNSNTAIRSNRSIKNNSINRRKVIVDYESAEYEVISSDECLDYLGLRINPARSIEAKPRVSREYNKNEFDLRLRRIIILLNGFAFRFQSDVKEKDYIVMIIGEDLTIPLSRFTEKGLVSDYHIEHFYNTLSYYSPEPAKSNSIYSYIDLAILIKLADKIYKSDEPENLIRDKAEYIDRHIKNQARSEIYLYKKSEPRVPDPTLIDHHPYSRLTTGGADGGITYTTSNKAVTDTGKHYFQDYDITDDYSEYTQTQVNDYNNRTVRDLLKKMETKKQTISNLNSYKGYKKYIQKLFNQDKLDEKQFNNYNKDCNRDIDETEQYLKDIVNTIYKLKAHLSKNISREAANMRLRLYQTAKNLEEADEQIQALKNNLNDIQNTSLLNKISSEINYDTIKNDLHTKQEELSNLIDQTNSNELNDSEILKKWEDLNSLKTDLNSELYDNNFNNFTQKITDNINKLNELSSLLSNRDKLRAKAIQKSKKGITYKDEAEFNKEFEKEYSERNKNNELAPELQNIINFN